MQRTGPTTLRPRQAAKAWPKPGERNENGSGGCLELHTSYEDETNPAARAAGRHRVSGDKDQTERRMAAGILSPGYSARW